MANRKRTVKTGTCRSPWPTRRRDQKRIVGEVWITLGSRGVSQLRTETSTLGELSFLTASSIDVRVNCRAPPTSEARLPNQTSC